MIIVFKPNATKSQIKHVSEKIKELGLKPRAEEKLKISKKDLPQEDMELVVLSL